MKADKNFNVEDIFLKKIEIYPHSQQYYLQLPKGGSNPNVYWWMNTKNVVLTNATGMNLEDITVSAISQSQKYKYYIPLLTVVK